MRGYLRQKVTKISELINIISAFINFYRNRSIEVIFQILPIAFYPRPKVESSMVKILPHTNLPYVANNYQFFNQLVASAFSQRRKTLANCLKKYCTKIHLANLNIDPKLRPEQLSVADFVNLSNSLSL